MLHAVRNVLQLQNISLTHIVQSDVLWGKPYNLLLMEGAVVEELEANGAIVLCSHSSSAPHKIQLLENTAFLSF